MSTNNETPTTIQVKKEKSKFMQFIKKHKGATFFFILLLVAIIWCLISTYKLKKEKENEELVIKYETMIDSIRTADYALTSKVFSWATRSDMLRSNYEQASLYAEEIVKHPDVIKVYAVDAKSNLIIISSDKKEVGLPIADITILNPNKSVVSMKDGVKRFTTPFAGLNNDIGILVTEIRIN